MVQQHTAGSRATNQARRWTAADMPDQSGRVAVITGANRGLGYEIARVLAAHGAQVVLACRDTAGARQAAARIAASCPRAPAPGVVQLDLSSLTSVRDAAAQLRAHYPRLDLLINNAGVMEVPYQRTEDGFELTLAANHLGHFALTGLLLDSLLAASGSRIVTMSSQAQLAGEMNFADLQSARSYDRFAAYAQSKLANLLFTYELDRRLTAAGARTAALAAHPGVVYTALFKHHAWPLRLLISPPARMINFWAVQNVQLGALPVLRAATDPAARASEFYGPHRRHDTGYPVPVESTVRSHDAADQARLWQISEDLTGVSYRITP